jgi:flavin reductase (DIM6/NTAB) family NADH-FMN oxidoreductase RutF
MSGTRWGKMIASTMVQNQHGNALIQAKYQLELDQGVAPYSNIANRPLQSLEHDSSNTHPVPLITGPGVLAQMECKVTRSIDIGDHTVLFAEVLDLTNSTTKTGEAETNNLPNHDKAALLYYDGEYAAIGEQEHSKIS